MLLLLSSVRAAEPDDEHPQLVRVGMVAPDVVEVEIQAGQVEYGRQVTYEEGDGDRVDPGRNRWVSRGGVPLGALAGKAGALLHTHDRLLGAPLDTAWADRAASYRLAGTADARFRDGLLPTRVDRKSKPTDLARTGPWQFAAPVRHHLFLQFAAALQNGQSYALSFADSALPVEAFWDVFWYPSMCEYTVNKPLAPNAYAWGYLASRR